MSTQKGNQKHLNLSDRISIEKGLNNNDSFATIAKVVQKDPTTISKEVRKHSKVKEYKGYANTPCEANKDKHSPCMLKHVCGDLECDRICRQCPKQRCSDICEAYRPQQCLKLSKAPYVCNGCGKRVNCMMEKKIYSSKYADDCYRETLSSSREGINQTPEILLDSQTQEEVLRVFSFLEAELGTDLFKHLFEVILTDGGSEFSDRTGMETSSDGKTQRTTVYYCDPYSFWQKGCCEKNHEYIRYVRKKGSSFDDLDQDKVTLLANHINNTKRDSLNRHSPFELSQLLLDDQLLSAMGYEYIAPDDVVLTPDLIK